MHGARTRSASLVPPQVGVAPGGTQSQVPLVGGAMGAPAEPLPGALPQV